MTKILIADDDKEIAELIADCLEYEGYLTVIAHDGNEVIQKLSKSNDIDMILLDIMMPGMDGLDVCAQIRESFVGSIIFISALNRSPDTLKGLMAGGDDYIAKPFSVDELVARVKAHIRREKRLVSAVSNSGRIELGTLTLYKDNMEVVLEGKRIELTTREFQLLLFLAENAGKVLSRDVICKEVWGEGYYDINTVTVHIKNLRDKLDPKSTFIKTVWGEGYKLSAPLAVL